MIKNALETQLSFIRFSIGKNLEGVTHEDSLKASADGGNCMNWVLGHIVVARTGMLALFGGAPTLDEDQRALYARQSKPIGPGSDCVPFDELERAFDTSQSLLIEQLQAADDALWSTKVPGLFDPDKREPCGVQLATLVFHEAYHAGQLGTIRRAIGMRAGIE